MTTPTSTPLSREGLAKEARLLTRQIYASLPFGYRIARTLTVLAGDALDSFGRTMYAEMILAAVRDQPDIGGKPASDWIQDVHAKGADVLPQGTGRRLAERVYKILLSRFSDPEIAQEAMVNVMLQAARKKLHIRNGASLRDAENYVITSAMNAARSILRTRARKQETPLEWEEDGTTIDIEDPRAFDSIDKLLPEAEIRKIFRELASVHPRAPGWFSAQLEGLSGREIAKEWGSTPSWVAKWQRQYLPRVQKVVENHLRTARSASSEIDHPKLKFEPEDCFVVEPGVILCPMHWSDPYTDDIPAA